MIKIVELTKSFGNSLAVDHISLQVNKAEIIAFLGPNGAGKTTTIKILTTLLKPTAGRVEIDGVDPVRQPLEVRGRFGIVFQDPSLDGEMTAWENLKMHAVLFKVPKSETDQRIDEILELVGLADRRTEFVKSLSGGLKRRLELGRALLHNPKVLFLDEPTLGLDPQVRSTIWDYIELMRQERKLTVFFTTHYMDEAERNADRVAIINHGKIVAEGTPDELKANSRHETLEDAFIALTGSAIGNGVASAGAEHMRMAQKVWRYQ